MISISGKVIRGQQFGRVLGFPTANLDRRQYAREKLKVKFGVWAGIALLPSRPTSASEELGDLLISNGKQIPHSDALVQNGRHSYKAAIVIGPIDKTGKPKLEAHLLNFKGNLYGKKVTIILKKYIRSFKQYKNIEILKKQIAKDIIKIKKLTI